MISSAKTEITALFNNGHKFVVIRTIIMIIDHAQLPMTIQTDTFVAVEITNRKITQLK